MNRKILVVVFGAMSLATLLVACGAGSNTTSSFSGNPVPPSPITTEGSYNGTPYSKLPQPESSANGVLANSYPESYFPVGFSPYGLQIAYGRNNEASVAGIVAYVRMDTDLCTATPVKYVNGKTYLIGAAHCFVNQKNNPTTLQASNIIPTGNNLYIESGLNANLVGVVQIPITAVFLRQDYCLNATFSKQGDCPNFTPSQGVNGGQGNDIAIIEINGMFGESSGIYPQVVSSDKYPQPYTMAPILSIGYGNTNNPASGNGKLYYVAGYQYLQQDATGYHYLYNSYYNFGEYAGQTGYTALICGGDSGGPDLFWTGQNWILLSEHTYGPQYACGTFYNYLPNGATNVSAYYSWIQSILTSESPVTSCKNGTIANCVTNG